jgi:hypothetical protein
MNAPERSTGLPQSAVLKEIQPGTSHHQLAQDSISAFNKGASVAYCGFVLSFCNNRETMLPVGPASATQHERLQAPSTVFSKQESRSGCESAREYSQGQLQASQSGWPRSADDMETSKSYIARPSTNLASTLALEGGLGTGLPKKRDYSESTSPAVASNEFRRQSESETDAEPPNSTRRLTESGLLVKTPRSVQHRPEMEASTRSAKRLCSDFKIRVQELFDNDKAQQANVEWALTYELTRTCQGGTDKTRIAELANLVKNLRRAVCTYRDKIKELHKFIALQEKRQSETSRTVDIEDLDGALSNTLSRDAHASPSLSDVATPASPFRHHFPYKFSMCPCSTFQNVSNSYIVEYYQFLLSILILLNAIKQHTE